MVHHSLINAHSARPQQLISLLPLLSVPRLQACGPCQKSHHSRSLRTRSRPHDDLMPMSPESFLAACSNTSTAPGVAGTLFSSFSCAALGMQRVPLA